jgi:heme/copper-type cytochrome/quinol oxidase subunit 2
MAEIHVQTKRHHINPGWVWTWVILAILIIAAVVYFVYVSKNKNNQNEQTQRNTPISVIEWPQQLGTATYALSACG